MPFINTKTNISLSRKQKENVKQQLGEAITTIPGKTEQFLMVGFEDSLSLYLAGDNIEPCAIVTVEIFGSTTDDIYAQMTEKITNIVSTDLSIKPERIYVNYKEISHWGMNGKNF